MARSRSHIVIATLALPLLLAAPATAQPEAKIPEHKMDYAEDFQQPFKGARETPGMTIYGPDATECVQFEPEGMRIALPLGFPRQRPGTGVVTQFGVKGDFEVTARFEILKEPNAGVGGNVTSLKLLVVPRERPEPGVWFKATQNRAAIAREAAGRGNIGGFSAALAKWNPDVPKDNSGNENFAKVETSTYKRVIAKAKAGRLRLIRTGADIFFYYGEADNDFTLLDRQAFGTKELKDVRILGATGMPTMELDVRVSDFRIRADGFVKQTAPTLPPPAPGAQAEAGETWLIAILAIGGILIAALFAVILAVIFFRARGRPAGPESSGAPAFLTLSCPKCGKRLKTKAEGAGRKIKCPGCSAVVAVPAAAEEPA